MRLLTRVTVILSEAFFASRRIWASPRARSRSCGIEIRRAASFPIALCALLLLSSASAQTLSGTLKNGTTNKPAGGDDVVLIKLGEGMEEAARTKADAGGHFSFKLPDAGPHLIRAIHQGVTYHRMAPPGTDSVELQVFDVSKKIEGISVTADVMRFQAQGNQLQGTRLFAVNNTSDPPRTQMNDQNFEFYLPEGARIADASAETAGGQPINSAPVPQKDKNRYAFIFPLRPGQTLFQVGFELPYSGEASIDPKALYPAQHFVVMLPKTMQFSAGPGRIRKNPVQRCRWHRTLNWANRWLSRFRVPVRWVSPGKTARAALPEATAGLGPRRDAIPVRAEDWARPSMRRILWKNIAGTSWEDLGLYWPPALSTLRPARAAELSPISAPPMWNCLSASLSGRRLRAVPPCSSKP